MLVALAKTKGQLKLSFCFCIAPLKKISAENPYDIRGLGVFLMLFSLLLRDLNKTTGILLSAKKDITLFSRQFAKPLYYGWSES